MKARTYTISELAREYGVTPRALRFYEDKDLLHPARDGINRVYSARDRARLQLIVRGKRVGFSLSDIRELIDLYDIGDGQFAQLKTSQRKFQSQVATLERQRGDIEHAIEELRRGIDWISARLADGPGEADQQSARAYEAVARARLDENDAPKQAKR
jgi:DNA-binding transcriptional MerR regulator